VSYFLWIHFKKFTGQFVFIIVILVQHFDLGRRSAITFPEPEAMDLDNVIMV
jgi:hypothetical protein